MTLEEIYVLTITVIIFVYVVISLKLYLRNKIKTSVQPKKNFGKYVCMVCQTKFDGDVCPRCGWIREENKNV